MSIYAVYMLNVYSYASKDSTVMQAAIFTHVCMCVIFIFLSLCTYTYKEQQFVLPTLLRPADHQNSELANGSLVLSMLDSVWRDLRSYMDRKTKTKRETYLLKVYKLKIFQRFLFSELERNPLSQNQEKHFQQNQVFCQTGGS